jgi:hypothetical protein
VTSDLAVQPDRLHRHAGALDVYRDRAARIRDAAGRSGVDPILWGPVGTAVGLPDQYRALSTAIHRHLDASLQFLTVAAERMAGTAARYAAAEEASGHRLDQLARVAGGHVPPIDLRDAHTQVPVSGSIETGAGALRSGRYGEAVAACLDLGWSAYSMIADPFGFLCEAGLGYLVNVVQPVEDLLGLVTGNGDRLGRDAQGWQLVADQLADLAGSLRTAIRDDLSGWTGQASAAARDRLWTFAAGLSALSAEVAELVALLTASQTAMDAAQSMILDILAGLVEWLVVSWTAAQAASVASLGGSEVAAMSATLVEVDGAAARAAAVVHRVHAALQRVEQAFAGLARDVLDAVPARGLPLDGPARQGGALRALGLSTVSGLGSAGVTALGGLLDALPAPDRPLLSPGQLDRAVGRQGVDAVAPEPPPRRRGPGGIG